MPANPVDELQRICTVMDGVITVHLSIRRCRSSEDEWQTIAEVPVDPRRFGCIVDMTDDQILAKAGYIVTHLQSRCLHPHCIRYAIQPPLDPAQLMLEQHPETGQLGYWERIFEGADGPKVFVPADPPGPLPAIDICGICAYVRK